MQQLFAAEIQKRVPGTQAVIATPFPGLDVRHYVSVPLVKSRRRNLPLAGMHLAILALLRLFGHSARRYLFDAEIDAMARADAVVDLSGDMLTEDYGPLVGISHFLPLLQALALGRPLVICAQSVGPFRRLMPMARFILSRARLITVRERFSGDLLKQLGLTSVRPIRTADLAFMLTPAIPERIGQILAHEGVPVRSTSRLGVSVSALLANRANRHLVGASGDKITLFAKALDCIVESRGVEILLVSHVFGPRPSGDDRLIAERVAHEMCHDAHVLHGEYRPEEIKGVIATCDYFVGCRMHANIAALDSGVPVVGVGYSHKTLGIMADFGLEKWVMDVETLTESGLVAMLELLMDQSSKYREQLVERLPEIRRRSHENIELVARLIEADVPV